MRAIRSWPLISLFTALAVVALVAVTFLLPSNYAVGLLALGAVVFVVMLVRNPAWRYWRMAVTVISGWLAATFLPNLVLKVKWQDDLLVDLWLNQDPGWGFHVAALGLAGLLIVADVLLEGESGIVRRFAFRLQSHSPSAVSHGGSVQQTIFGDFGDNATVNLTQTTGPTSDELAKLVQARPVDANAEIDVAAERLRDGQPDIAIHLLTEIRKKHWDRLTPREKYRLVANLGHAAERQGEFRTAARHYIEAKSYQPEDEKGRCYEAIGYALLEDRERAHALALGILNDHPHSVLATVVRLRCAPEATPFTELEQSIPAVLREDGEVLHTLSTRAFHAGELLEGERLARLAKEQHPDAPEVLEWFGLILVQSQARADSDDRPVNTEKLREAIAALSVALEKTRGKKGKAHVRYTRAEAFALLDQFEEAETDYRTALDLNPADEHVALRFAMRLERNERRDPAIEVLRRSMRTGVALGNKVILANLLGARNQPGDADEAVRLLRGSIEQASSAKLEERASLIATLAQLHCLLNQATDAVRMLESLPPGYLSESASLVVRADVLWRAGSTSQAVVLGRRALTSLTAAASEPDRLRVAHLLTRLKEYKDALSVWKQVVRPTCANEEVWSALECAKQVGDDNFILSFCSQLRANGVVDPYGLELEVLIRERYREHATAIDIMREYLTRPTSDALARVFRVRLSLLGLRLDRPELVENDPTKLPRIEDVKVDVGGATAHVLRYGAAPHEGVRYAYELLRRHFGDPDARQIYLGVFGVGDGKECDPLPASDVAGPSYAVHYREDGSAEDKWVILEDSLNPSHERNEIGPTHLLFAELSQKKVGDKFYIRRDELMHRTGTILGVMSKYGYRLKEIFETWEERFPDRPLVRKYTIPTKDDGSPDVAPLFQMLDRLESQHEQGRAFYRDNPLSVATYAKLTNTGLLRALHNLASEGTLRVRCCTGNAEELQKAVDAIRSAEVLVIEPTALATLFFSDQYENISRLRTKCVVCESALEEYREFQKSMRFPSKGFSGKRYGKHLYWDDDAAARDRERERITTFLDRIRELVAIESGSALAEVDAEQRKGLINLFGQPVAESIATAMRPKRVLWTDDMIAAICAGEQHHVRSVWTQFVFQAHLSATGISQETYNDLTLYLLNCRYFYTRLEPYVFLAACRHARWDMNVSPLVAAIEWFATPEILTESVLKIGAGVFLAIWLHSPLITRAEEVTRAVALAVHKREDGREVIATWIRDIDHIFRMAVVKGLSCRACLEDVLRGASPGGLIVPGFE